MKRLLAVCGYFALTAGLAQAVVGYDLVPSSNGPAAGGNILIITNYTGTLGSGSDITNIVFDTTGTTNIPAQGTKWVQVVVPAHAAGAVNIYVQSTSMGQTMLSYHKYTFNPAGAIGACEDWNQWQEVEGLPQGRAYLAGGVLNGALYAIGGRYSYAYMTNVFRYNGTNWTEVKGLPARRQVLTVGVLDGALYAIGGHDGSTVKTNVYRYNGTNWTQTAGLPDARGGMAAATLNGALYVVGGFNSSDVAQTNMFRFDGTNWSEVAGLPAARYYLAADVLNGAMYAVGGNDGSSDKTNVFMYNGTNWAEVAGTPVAASQFTAGVLNGGLYSVGGGLYTNVICYSGTNWTSVAAFPDIRFGLAGGVLNGALYAFGGVNGDEYTNVYRYPAIIGSDPGVSPISGSITGGYPVVITGTNLGNEADITNVTICGVSVASISSRSATQVVVVAGAGAPGLGAVAIYSTSYGVTIKSNVFTYLAPGIAVLGTNGAVVANGEPATAGKGTDFGRRFVGYSQTNIFAVTNTGNETLNISGWTTNGADAAKFVISGIPSAVPASSTVQFQVAFSASATGTFNASLFIVNNATNYTVNLSAIADKQDQTITYFRNPGTQYITNTVHLQAEASSGLPVTNFTVGYGPGEISGLTNLTFTDTGMVCIIAGQAGDANWNPAPSVSNRFKVTAYIYPALSTNACWTWMKGTNIVNQNGTYGTQGVPAPANTPGARESAVAWTDDAGAFWLFGGYGYPASPGTGRLNDLWKFDPATTNWTWIKGATNTMQNGTYGTQGVPAPANTPGARDYAVSWTDGAGAFWLFGGYGYSASGVLARLNDLWKYDQTTTNWTWIKGATNINQTGTYGTQGVQAMANTPGARDYAVSWTDSSGALWLFGGYGFPASPATGYLNDLWKFDPATTNWTWIKGANIIDRNGIYGTQGVPASANMPGARYGALSWTDSTGAFWLFGGYGYPASGGVGYLNDLWKFDPATTNWTWVKGTNIADQSGIYGMQGVPAPSNTPGARFFALSWTDSTGALWLFGGKNTGGYFNDLWKFDPATTNWTWVKGTNIVNQNGTYGIRGVPAPANTPGTRERPVSWVDNTGALWLFGGSGYPAAGGIGYLNDLWKFDALGGGISLNTNALAFSATYQGANPIEQMIGMTNVGGRAFNYTNVIAYGAGASGWLTVLPSTGIIASGSATILTNQVNIAGLGAGTYYATNQIVAADATNSPQIVVVTLTVSKADQAITNFPNPGPQFTTNVVHLFAQASSGLAVTNFTVSGPGVISGLTNLTFTNFGVVSVKADQAGDANWNAAPTVTNTFTVTRVTATVNLTDLSQTYNGTARPVTTSTAPTGLPLTVTYDGNAWAPTNAGSYAVTGIVDSAHPMYQGTSVVTLTVGKASQTITFNNPGQQLTTNVVGLAMSSDSGLAVTGSVISGSAYASIANGTNLTFTGYGVVTIQASQTGDVNYLAAEPVYQTIMVTRATAAVNLTGLSQTYNGTARMVTTSTVPVGLPLTITYNGNTWAPTNAGSYAVTGMVNTAHPMYQGTSVVTLTVSAATLTVTPKAVATNYNGGALDNTVYSTNTANYDITGFSNSETVVSAGVTLSGSMAFNGSTATVVRAVGTYTQEVGSLAMSCTANNYSMNFANPATNNYVITAAALTITANNDSKTYGQTKSYGAGLTNFASVGLQGTDTVGTVTITAGGGTESNAAVGAYALIPSDATAGTFNTNNYAITYSNGTLQVGAAALTVTATATNKVYGDADPALAYAITSGQLVGSDSITGTMARAAGENVGDYPMQQGSLGAGANYDITFVPANLTITVLPVVLNGTRAYDGTTAADHAILSVSNKVGGDNVLPVSGSATLVSSNVGVRAFSSLGTLALGGTQSSNYTLIGAGGSVTITQATATVALNNLSQTYDGTARLVTATTVPAGLAVLITYDGGAAAPVNAGSYAVIGTIVDGNHQGVANGTLVVAKVNQTITFPVIPDQIVTSQVALAAAASSGLPVTFAVVSGPAQILTGNVLTFTGVGVVTVAAVQLGDANWNSAVPVANTFDVTHASTPIVGIPNADFDGDGLADPATYDENTGNWKIMMSAGGYATMSLPHLLGGPGWVAAVGDYDGDGLSDPAVFQDTTGDWILMKSGSGYAQLHVYALLGAPGWAPDSANFTGDRVWEFTVYQEATGNWTFKLGGMVGALEIYKYNLIGGPGYSPVSADFDGDGYADPTVYNRTDGTWKLLLSGSGYFPLTLPHFLGGMGWSAVPADYDGDGLADPAVRKDDGSIWRIMLSRIGYFTIDVPLGL